MDTIADDGDKAAASAVGTAAAAATDASPLLLYRDRVEWRDVTPIYNSDAEEAVVHIAATEEFVDAFAYLRALLNSNEASSRACAQSYCTLSQ